MALSQQCRHLAGNGHKHLDKIIAMVGSFACAAHVQRVSTERWERNNTTGSEVRKTLGMQYFFYNDV